MIKVLKLDSRFDKVSNSHIFRRKSTSLLSLPSAENAHPPILQRLRLPHRLEKSDKRASSHRLDHAISTPNLASVYPTSSLLPAWDESTADSLVIERCPQCGLPDLTPITATTTTTPAPASATKHQRAFSLETSVSLPSLPTLDSNLLASGGVQGSSISIVNIRPTMRRLKNQHRHKAAIFPRRRNAK